MKKRLPAARGRSCSGRWSPISGSRQRNFDGGFHLDPHLSVFRMAMSDVSRAGKIKGFNGIENFVKGHQQPLLQPGPEKHPVWTVAVVVISTVLGFHAGPGAEQQVRGPKVARAIVVFPGHYAGSSRPVPGTRAQHRLRHPEHPADEIGLISAPVNWTPPPRLTSPGRSPAASSSPFPLSHSASSLFGLQSIDTPTTRLPRWTEPATSRSCSASRCLW